MREGFAYEYLAPPARSFAALFPYYAGFRDMARLLRLEGQTRAGHGNWGGAINSDLDCIRFGVHICRGATLIGMLVGRAIQGIGRRDAWKYADRLSAAQARAAARRMEDIVARQVPFADTLREEKWCGQAGLIEMVRSGGVSAAGLTIGAVVGGGAPSSASDVMERLRCLLYGKRGLIRNYTRYMDQLAANARRPYAARLGPPKIPTDPLTRILVPVFVKARWMAVTNETQNAMLAVKLALRAYRVEHGRYPDRLEELAPAYLKKIPDDPCALRGPLLYRKLGAKYVLYSIGPDGRDDGGLAVNDPTRTNPRDRCRVEEISRGDIVAGINIY